MDVCGGKQFLVCVEEQRKVEKKKHLSDMWNYLWHKLYIFWHPGEKAEEWLSVSEEADQMREVSVTRHSR